MQQLRAIRKVGTAQGVEGAAGPMEAHPAGHPTTEGMNIGEGAQQGANNEKSEAML